MTAQRPPAPSPPPLQPATLDRLAIPVALLAWLVPLAVFSAAVIRDPVHRSLDPLYRSAFDAWRDSRSAYVGYGGVNYLPTFLSIYAPFEAMPQPWGQLLWRWLAAAGFAHALWLLLGSMERPRIARGYLLLTLVSLPITLGAIQIGQANAWLGVALLYAAVGLARPGTWRAAIPLAFGLAVKPLMIAAMGLAAIVRPRIVPAMAIASAIFVALPLLQQPASFIASEYRASLANLTGSCLWVEEDRFADLNGIFRAIGMPIASGVSAWLRVGAGMALAGLTLAIARRAVRIDDRELGWLWWLAATAGYLMLFNPMTESNSYCLMGIPMTLWAWRWLGAAEHAIGTVRPDRFAGRAAFGLGWGTLVLVTVMGTASEALRPWLGNSLDLWLLPSATLAFLLPMTLEALGLVPVRRPLGQSATGAAHA